jgi:hypothetical protein
MFTKNEQRLKSERRDDQLKNLFAKKSTDVIRVLLINYPKTWMMRDLAEESGVALGYASRVSKALIKQRLALRSSARAELKIIDPTELLRRWATFANFVARSTFIEYYTNVEDIKTFLKGLNDEKNREYALTGLAGALLVEPFVRPTNIHIYVKTEDSARKFAHHLDLMPIEENGNVKFVIAPSEGIFYAAQLIDKINVVSDIQLYVDLYNYPGRGREAADELYKKIEKKWGRRE